MDVTAPSQAALSITVPAKKFLYFVAYIKPGGPGIDNTDLMLRFNGDLTGSYNWTALNTVPSVVITVGTGASYIRCDGRGLGIPLSDNFIVGEIQNVVGGFKMAHLRCCDTIALSEGVPAALSETLTSGWWMRTAPSAKDSQITVIEISKAGSVPTILQGSYILVYGSD